MTIPITDIYLWLLVLCRCSTLVMSLPFGGETGVPSSVKVFLSASLSYFVVVCMPVDSRQIVLPNGYVQFALQCSIEVLVGLLMWFVLKITFCIVEIAGHFVANEIGINNGEIFNPVSDRSDNFVSVLMYQFAGVIFFVTGTYRDVLMAFINSYRYLSPGNTGFNFKNIFYLIEDTQEMFVIGCKIAIPLIVLNFLITFAFAILGKAAPKINIFFLSFPVRIMAGLLMFSFSIYLSYLYISEKFLLIPDKIIQYIVE